MPQILQGQIKAFFAFDIGYAISLEKVAQLFISSPKQPLSQKKQTPTYLQYTQPPHVISLGQAPFLFPEPGEIEATLFDFGAVSLAYRWTLADVSLDILPSISQQLFEQKLEAHAIEQVQALIRRIHSAIVRAELSPLVEDYYVFILESLDKPLKGERLLRQHHTVLAQTLQFDTELLSQNQRNNALANAISYYERDMVVIDWNASIIYDSEYIDTLNVLELLNIELLEARYMDAQLDQRIKNYETLNQSQPVWYMPLSIPHRQTIQELAELRIESAVLAERVDNALKLIGDLYLARIYSAASEQFHMPAWDASISRKLDIIGNLYQVLTDRVNSTQTQLMELIIILLILIEIVLSLTHSGHV